MLFNSLTFAVFLPVVFILYWFVTNKNLKVQNSLLLVASYFFYAYWDWRFLFLLLFSTLLDYFMGLEMCKEKDRHRRRKWLLLSVISNLGFLGVFKYYDFFTESLVALLSSFGLHTDPWLLKVVLPVGISFYTFHGLSYVLDVYHGKISAEKNFVNYAVFVSFFPLLVAGPIERATHLLPQIKVARTFNYVQATDGMRQILWGLFKKIVIADNCAIYVDEIFNGSSAHSGSSLLLGAVLFAIQIYGDFSGYSDIAIGTARLFGIDLLRNFSFPYFSRDIAEFWRRWHISLTSWFKDYLYIPLGGSRCSTQKRVRNIFIIFLLSGFWHGANWTFLFWGVLNAIYFLPLLLTKRNRKNIEIVAKGKLFPSMQEFFSILLTFFLSVIAWIFFRSETVQQGFSFISGIFSKSLFSLPQHLPLSIFPAILFFILIEWLGRENEFAIAKFGNGWSRYLRWSFYSVIIFLIGLYMPSRETPFIYFQF